MVNNKKKTVKTLMLMSLLLMVYSSFSLSAGEDDTTVSTHLERAVEPEIVSSSVHQLKKINVEPTKPHQLPNYGKDIAEMLFYLGLIVGLIFFLAWLVKKAGHNRLSQTQLMKVTACLPLSTKEKLMVVQIGDEQIVIGVAPGFVGHITSLKQPLVDGAADINAKALVDDESVEKDHAGTTAGTTSFATLLSRLQYGK
jgi:flagellar biosynthetic protein FliO